MKLDFNGLRISLKKKKEKRNHNGPGELLQSLLFILLLILLFTSPMFLCILLITWSSGVYSAFSVFNDAHSEGGSRAPPSLSVTQGPRAGLGEAK